MSAQVKAGFVDIGDGKLYYEEDGDGDTLVLAHAGFVDSGMWDDQWGDFTRHFHVIRFDMRGYGKSDPVSGPVSRRDDLYHLLQALDIQRAHLLGCSMSGQVILDFALEHAAMVSALIPVSASPSGLQPEGKPPRDLLEMVAASKQQDWDRVSDLQMRIWVDGPHRQPDEVDPNVRRRAAEMNQIPVRNNTWAADAQPLNPLNPPAIGRLNEIEAPTLIIAGALDDPEILRAADVLESEIKNSQKHIIRDAAHVPNMEKPAAFNRVVLDFLRGLE
jgi:pimeloyl-ACP methyl ester carboxylesterase